LDKFDLINIMAKTCEYYTEFELDLLEPENQDLESETIDLLNNTEEDFCSIDELMSSR